MAVFLISHFRLRVRLHFFILRAVSRFFQHHQVVDHVMAFLIEDDFYAVLFFFEYSIYPVVF